MIDRAIKDPIGFAMNPFPRQRSSGGFILGFPIGLIIIGVVVYIVLTHPEAVTWFPKE